MSDSPLNVSTYTVVFSNYNKETKSYSLFSESANCPSLIKRKATSKALNYNHTFFVQEFLVDDNGTILGRINQEITEFVNKALRKKLEREIGSLTNQWNIDTKLSYLYNYASIFRCDPKILFKEIVNKKVGMDAIIKVIDGLENTLNQHKARNAMYYISHFEKIIASLKDLIS